MKLYHYVHCPFCIRVRMALGFLKINYESVVLPYHDEHTPNMLCNKKMLPIFRWSNTDQMNESLDIIRRLDDDNKLKLEVLDDRGMLKFIEKYLNVLGNHVHSLCMPYWVYTPEFDVDSRRYFVQKKSQKRGPFHLLIQNKDDHLVHLPALLNEAEHQLNPFYKSEELTILDIMVASHMWGLYIFPEFQFSPALHEYLQRVKKLCNFNYHEDFWKQELDLEK